DDGTGKVQIPYNSFVEENGDYYFQVKYKGEESPPVIYEEKYVVEILNISAEVGKVASGGQLNLTVTMLDDRGGMMTPRGAELTIDEIDLIDDPSPPIINDEPPQPVSESFIREEYPYSQGGNYSISVTVENSRVKSDSDYFTVTETRVMFLNIQPIATADYIYGDPDITTYTVTFDAIDSWNDGIKTKHIWDFDGNGEIDEETTDPVIEHIYSMFQSSPGETQGTYNALLNVEGDIMVWDDIDKIYVVEKGATVIHVTPP
ncbi:MAG: hypothetical protein V3U20_01280, partial [Thermoplasmata archaeon]